jgi:large conductance mechanosensitive channel
MKIIDEFKSFAIKGNVVDMAVGVIIGGAFGKIVSSFINDVIMPPLGFIIGGVNFTELKLMIREASENTPAVTLNYGNFLQTTFDFIIVAMAIFALVKGMNTLKAKEEAKPNLPTPPSKSEQLLEEIRDLLKK